MSYRRAHSLTVLLEQVNRRFPLRDTGSDGWIGDAAHRSRPSDHNPTASGIVLAQDFDEDAKDSPETAGRWLWDRLLASRDPRVAYVIYEGRTVSSYPARGYAAWQVRPYTGPNKHLHHLHLSVSKDPALYDDPRPWALEEDDVALSDEDKKWIERTVERSVQRAVDAAHGAVAARDFWWRRFAVLEDWLRSRRSLQREVK